jgi:predicted transcriptional regulator
MSDTAKSVGQQDDLLAMSADLVAKYVSKNYLPPHQVTPFFRSIYEKLTKAALQAESREGAPVVADAAWSTTVAESIHQDYLVCLEDGEKLTMLKRYLRTQFDMSPEEYRAKWNLPADYPMVAPSQSLKRSRNAKKLGLGHTVRRSKRA